MSPAPSADPALRAAGLHVTAPRRAVLAFHGEHPPMIGRNGLSNLVREDVPVRA